MKHKVTITPVSNINFDEMEVIDHKLIDTKEFDGDEEVSFYNTVNKSKRKGRFIDVSVYDDYLLEDGVEYKILHMLTL